MEDTVSEKLTWMAAYNSDWTVDDSWWECRMDLLLSVGQLTVRSARSPGLFLQGP
jgi:hypothetical protein